MLGMTQALLENIFVLKLKIRQNSENQHFQNVFLLRLVLLNEQLQLFKQSEAD